MVKYIALVLAFLCLGVAARLQSVSPERTEKALKQLEPGDMSAELNKEHILVNSGYSFAFSGLAVLGVILVCSDIQKLFSSKSALLLVAVAILGTTGCRRPFEPVKLEKISTNEEAFLLPLTGDLAKQTTSNTEEYLTKNLVFVKQVKIPQQWVSKGYETIAWNGEWQDAAILIKVDKSPVTREWTADKDSGTSTKNEAIWVMTADQVEFSTGWTCTARIADRSESVKFLHNYPNGSLENVMDKEIRARLQSAWTLEVTDLPMSELRNAATPHILKVCNDVTTFFKARGIEITNLGITGGFVYKDGKIHDTMVELFNAEQEKAKAKAATEAQEEKNNKLKLEAEGLAAKVLKERQAEADGIKLVADAKAYEMEKAQANSAAYFQLKQIELEKEKLTKWDGRFPSYYMGTGSPELLLQVPNFVPNDAPQTESAAITPIEQN